MEHANETYSYFSLHTPSSAVFAALFGHSFKFVCMCMLVSASAARTRVFSSVSADKRLSQMQTAGKLNTRKLNVNCHRRSRQHDVHTFFISQCEHRKEKKN